MAKVFFGCSMRGGQELVSKEELYSIKEAIKELGYALASEHQTKKGIVKEELSLSTTEIHDRDYKWLMESDVGVFEITNGSIGTGGEISDMVHLGKPILCLYKKELEDQVSAYGRGKQGSEFVKTPFVSYGYETVEDAKSKIQEFVEKYLNAL